MKTRRSILNLSNISYFYQFLFLSKFNTSSFLYLSISPSPYFSQLLFSPNLSISPLHYFYQFLLLLIFINFSSSLFLPIPLSPQIYQFLFLPKFINSSSFLFLSISLLVKSIQPATRLSSRKTNTKRPVTNI